MLRKSAKPNPDIKPVVKPRGVNGRFQRRSEPAKATISSSTFKGETDSLQGAIYDVGVSNQSELFTTTTKKIAGFAGRTCKEPKDISLAIENLEDPTFPTPTKLNVDPALDDILLKNEVDIYVKRKSTYRQNQATMFSVVLGQCTEALKAKLEADSNYDSILQSRDVIKLLLLIREIAFNYESDKYPYLAVHTSMKAFYEQFQKYSVSADSYLESFTNLYDVVSACGGTIGEHENLEAYMYKKKKINPTTASDAQKATVKKHSIEAYKATAFLCGLNQTKYQHLLDDLSNSFLNGRDEYPKDLVAAYNLVLNWAGSEKYSYSDREGVAFGTVDDQDPEITLATDGIIRRRDGVPVSCVICGGNHWPSKCPNKRSRRGNKNNNDSTSPGEDPGEATL